MSDAMTNFRKRESALRRKHMRMAQGFTTKMDHAGLIIQVPDNKAGSIGLRLAMKLVLVILAFKVLVLSWLGQEAYVATLNGLSVGTLYERAGAWIMQIDPVTKLLSDLVAPFFG
ncbi:hypothetical protein [Antarctobacter jejuensis]|uniref:hypothetical protein n=1 Tax=Antarctobacter jejuensis TaxID=1439938 RepID=UPI003FD44273